MSFAQISWTDEMLQAEAEKYQTRMDFVRESYNAYQRAAKRGLLDQICGHMQEGLRSDDDVIYIWRALGETYRGEQLYKIGVTSERLGDIRISQVASAQHMTPQIIAIQNVEGRASTLEKALLELGEDPKFSPGTDGYSEFRALSDSELVQALNLISETAKK
jgi:hypothetical protein